MNIKQKKLPLIAFFLVACFGVIASFFIHATDVYALCSENAGTTDQCYFDNYNTIKDKNGITKAQYDQYVQNCRGKGGGWLGGGADEGSCSNAVSGCIQNAITISNCSNGDIMASVAGCNAGDVMSNNCLMTLNVNDFSSVTDSTRKTISDTCTTRTGSEAQDIKDCDKLYSEIQEKCNNLRTGNRYKKEVYSQFSECMSSAMKSSSKDQAECTSRGGVWVDKDYKDPVGNSQNDVTNGCKNNYSDIINKPACISAGGTWGRTGGGTFADNYGCISPNGTAGNQNGDPSKPPIISNSDNEKFNKCGKAQTVLIACSETEGALVINSVLKIIINVITALIGVVAVGGLAWGSILYAKAEDNASEVTEARTLIRNIVIGLLLYGFLIAIINWLVPGGVIR